MKHKLIFFTLFYFCIQLVNASNSDTILNKADILYEKGQYDESLSLYHEIEQTKYSRDLYYNMGNAYYRTGKFGNALLYYEKALKLDPMYEDAKYNIDIIRSKKNVNNYYYEGSFIGSFIGHFSRFLSSNSWAIFSLVVFWVMISVVGCFMCSDLLKKKQVLFILPILFIIFAFSLCCSLYIKSSINDKSQGVVVKNSVTVQKSPIHTSSTLLNLNEASKIKIVDQVDDYYEIYLQNGQKGWINKKDVVII